MTPSRRDFLKMAGVSTLTLIVPGMVSVARAKETMPVSGVSSPGGKPVAQALTAKRWAMVVDSSKCRADCVDCVLACREAHNIPDFGNPKDEVKWIWQTPFALVFPDVSHHRLPKAVQKKPLPILCNHCENPPCVRVCPTKATFRRLDGIVMMDYHRCIGCRFCMAACPYGARSMNYREPRSFIPKINPDYPTRTRGVVEKCNFCEERLARGIPPACVAACREKALVFGDLEDVHSEISRLVGNHFTLLRKSSLGTGPQVYYIL